MLRVFAFLQTGGMVLPDLHANIFCLSLGGGKEVLFGVYCRSGSDLVNTIFRRGRDRGLTWVLEPLWSDCLVYAVPHLVCHTHIVQLPHV